MKLSVNVDHVATLRQARGTAYPDLVEAARVAEAAGASGITIHLRSDRRHIQDADLTRLLASVAGKLNLEMAASDEMLAIAERERPHQVTLVPERPDELTTEGGLDLGQHRGRLRDVVTRLADHGIEPSLFVDPDPHQLEVLGDLGPVRGVELNTDHYTRAVPPAIVELERLRQAAQIVAGAGLAVYAGHGLTAGNVGPVCEVSPLEELNIGHALVSRAVLVGLGAAVEEMLAAMRAGLARRAPGA